MPNCFSFRPGFHQLWLLVLIPCFIWISLLLLSKGTCTQVSCSIKRSVLPPVATCPKTAPILIITWIIVNDIWRCKLEQYIAFQILKIMTDTSLQWHLPPWKLIVHTHTIHNAFMQCSRPQECYQKYSFMYWIGGINDKVSKCYLVAQITLFMYMRKLATFLVLSTSTEESLAMSFVKAGIQGINATFSAISNAQYASKISPGGRLLRSHFHKCYPNYWIQNLIQYRSNIPFKSASHKQVFYQLFTN